MNCTLTRATSEELDAWGVHANLPPATFSEHSFYATAPMAAILPPYEPPSEEELHTSFENAISDRVSALHGRLSRPSLQHPSVLNTESIHNVDPILRPRTTYSNATIQRRHLTHLPLFGWKRGIVLISLALIFMLIGFDLMGLLVLHMH
jgi:hypothetical protein